MNQTEWNKVAEVELIYRSKVKASERPQITSSRDAYNLLLQTWDENKIDHQLKDDRGILFHVSEILSSSSAASLQSLHFYRRCRHAKADHYHPFCLPDLPAQHSSGLPMMNWHCTSATYTLMEKFIITTW